MPLLGGWPVRLQSSEAWLESGRRSHGAAAASPSPLPPGRQRSRRRTASLEGLKQQLLALEAKRAEELQSSVARYAELEEVLALAEQSLEGLMDEEGEVGGLVGVSLEAGLRAFVKVAGHRCSLPSSSL